ncbi:hypothetical protein O8W32_01730 [Methanomassiliicoccales archaeon LGM-DZ1]|nr:hypothetical protein O8W32_01730 [Methanomassiliicoccales archaeon LGM-DZ1]
MEYVGLNRKYTVPDGKVPKTGGEGSVYLQNGLAIKIYHDSVLKTKGTELEQKLRYMCSNPPQQILDKLTWPIDVIYSNGVFKGYVMKESPKYTEFGEVYWFEMGDPYPQDMLLQIAYNLCVVTEYIHRANYIIGDFNPKNIGFLETGTKAGSVCVYDNDSFVFRANGKKYDCNVWVLEFVAPELQLAKEKYNANKAKGIAQKQFEVAWDKQTDYFALAVHIFKLMFNAVHPYSSDRHKIKPAGVSKPPEDVENNMTNYAYMFSPGCKPYEYYTPEPKYFPDYIMELFDRAFSKPVGKPDRPTPMEWIDALERYSNDICQCKKVPEHIYWKGSPKHNGAPTCPYCAAIQTYRSKTTPIVKTTVRHTVTFGNTNLSSKTVAHGGTIILPTDAQISMPGKVLTGWSLNGNILQPGATHTVNNDETLVAQFRNAYVAPQPPTPLQPTNTSLPPNPLNHDYGAILGWLLIAIIGLMIAASVTEYLAHNYNTWEFVVWIIVAIFGPGLTAIYLIGDDERVIAAIIAIAGIVLRGGLLWYGELSTVSNICCIGACVAIIIVALIPEKI